jgi:hypothetical protein
VAEQTVWHILEAPGVDEEIRIRLIVETTEPVIVEAIERAARYYRIELERED